MNFNDILQKGSDRCSNKELLNPHDIVKCIHRIEDSGALDIAKRALQTIKSILKLNDLQSQALSKKR